MPYTFTCINMKYIHAVDLLFDALSFVRSLVRLHLNSKVKLQICLFSILRSLRRHSSLSESEVVKYASMLKDERKLNIA